MILNQITIPCSDYDKSVAFYKAQGPRKVMEMIVRLQDDEAGLVLPKITRSAVLSLGLQLEALARENRVLERRLLVCHRQDAASQRLETIPDRVARSIFECMEPGNGVQGRN